MDLSEAARQDPAPTPSPAISNRRFTFRDSIQQESTRLPGLPFLG